MRFPPWLITLRIGRFWLWIPVVLLWPLLLALWLLAMPLLLIGAGFRWGWGGVRLAAALGPAANRLLMATKGTDIAFQTGSCKVRITIK